MSTGKIMIASGVLVSPPALRPQDVNIEDIATALSQVARFTGHTTQHVGGRAVPFTRSVASHSIDVSVCATLAWRERHNTEPPRELLLAALLHDGSEAYLADVATPLKVLPEFEGYRLIEERVQRAVYDRFGLGEVARQYEGEIREADFVTFDLERKTWMAESDHWPASPKHPAGFYLTVDADPVAAFDRFLWYWNKLQSMTVGFL